MFINAVSDHNAVGVETIRRYAQRRRRRKGVNPRCTWNRREL
jgi:hypothetical protein